MPLLGAHMSIAGGLHLAVERAAALSMDCVQIFTANPRQFPKPAAASQFGGVLTKNNNQWRSKPITDEDVKAFQVALKSTGVKSPVGHDSYLINLGSPDHELWQKSLDAFVHELERAERLGLFGLVMHPGSYVTSSEADGLARIILALDEAHRRTKGFKVLTLLETTAGQGTSLGHRFEHLEVILNTCVASERLGVCVDTCHIFAAGYPLKTKAEYEATMTEMDQRIGLSRVKAFHLNDSLKDQGSRVDRHAHIGRGKLGLEPFRHLLNDPRFITVPMYLETKKGTEAGEDLDAINLRVLRGLVAGPESAVAPRANTALKAATTVP